MAEISVLLDGFAVGTDKGILGLCSLILVEGEHRTLVDVGHVGRRVVAAEALARRGLAPGDVDAVVVTHAHWDHVQNLDVFPAARIHVHPDERRYALDPHGDDWATPAWTGAMLERYADRIVEVDDGHEIDRGVTVLHTPGHSVGSISLLVDTADGRALASGDALQFAFVAQSGRNPVVFWDDDLASTSIQRIVDRADVIYPGHDRPFRLTADGDIDYLRSFDLTVTGVKPTTPGLHFDAAPRERFVLRRSGRGA